jgi:predicted XRE-type DNA-binding protein
MDEDDTEIIRGSGNVFRDLNLPNADLHQARARLAAQIIAVLDERRLTTRAAEQASGVPHADFVRIRTMKLDRFTIDRMIKILGKLDQQVDVSFEIRPRVQPAKVA